VDFSERDVEQFVELMKSAVAFKPVVQVVLDVVKSYGPELSEIPEAMIMWGTKIQIQKMKMFEDAGYTKDQIVSIVTNTKNPFLDMTRQIAEGYKKNVVHKRT